MEKRLTDVHEQHHLQQHFLRDHHHVCYIYHNHNIVILISFSPHSCIQFVKFHGREADAHEQHQ